MNSGESMDAQVLMQKLVERDIDTSLLIEFYEEVVENEKIFCDMIEDISTADDIEERKRSVDHIERFCLILRELRILYDDLREREFIFLSPESRRELMISNASRFIEMLEKDCNLNLRASDNA